MEAGGVKNCQRQRGVLIKQFALSLGTNLPDVSNRHYISRRFFSIGESINNLSTESLIEMRSSIYRTKEEIFRLLNMVQQDKLKILESSLKSEVPPFFNDLFDLSGKYKQIDAMRSTPKKNTELSRFSQDLVQSGIIGVGMGMAGKIPERSLQSSTYKKIFRILIKIREFVLALEAVHNIEKGPKKNTFLLLNCKVLMKKRDCLAAYLISQFITVKKEKLLGKLCIGLSEAGQGDKAYEIVQALDSKVPYSTEDKYLILMSKAFMEWGNMDNSLKFATKISGVVLKCRHLEEMYKVLMEKGDIVNTFKAAMTAESAGADLFILDIAKAVVAKGNLDEIMKMISPIDGTSRSILVSLIVTIHVPRLL